MVQYARSWSSERIYKVQTILQSLPVPSALTHPSLAFPQFKALRRLSSLPLSPLKPSSKLYEDLASRGKVYVTLSGVRFLQYDGVLSQEVGYGMNKTIIKLRVRSISRMDQKRAS